MLRLSPARTRKFFNPGYRFAVSPASSRRFSLNASAFWFPRPKEPTGKNSTEPASLALSAGRSTMYPSGLLRLLVPALIIPLAIAVSAQAPPATTSDSASDPNVLINRSIIEMAAARLPEEVIITKIQTLKTNFDLSTPALVELNTRWGVRQCGRGSPTSVTKETT